MSYNNSWIPKEHRGGERPSSSSQTGQDGPMHPYEGIMHCLKDYWRKKDKHLIRQILFSNLASLPVTEHHGLVFFLLDRSDDLRNKKPDSLGFVILKEFETIMKRYPEKYETVIQSFTESYKLGVLQLATMAHANVFSLICQLYGLDRPGNDYLSSHVRVMLTRHQYKEASVCVTVLNLQHVFQLDEIVLPLIFQDKVNLVELYVKPSKELQEALIRRLDSCCSKDFDLKSFVDSFSIPATRLEKLRPKNLSKLIVRLMKLFDLDASVCPNTLQFRELGSIRYLLYKKYIDKSISETTWAELVTSTVGSDGYLQKELIELLMSYNDAPLAAKFARRFGLPVGSLHPIVQRAMKDLPLDGPKDSAEENWDNEVGVGNDEIDSRYHKLRLTDDCIVTVDNANKLESCARTILQPSSIIGMDMEWKPSLTIKQSTSQISVIQLAASHQIFLLDMIALSGGENRTLVERFFSDLFASRDVVKLGYGVETDFLMLRRSYPFLQASIKQRHMFVDLAVVQENAARMSLDLFEYPGDGTEKGLSELMLFCFGKALNKMEQMSNWEIRPLRRAQVNYAALDAYCLLEVYHYLNEKLKEIAAGLDVVQLSASNLMNPSLTGEKPKKNKKATKKEKERRKLDAFRKEMKQVSTFHKATTSVRDFRVVCDNMLQGLGRYLRACGADVKILENSDDHDIAAKLAREEGRVILTSGIPYQTLKSHVQEGCCMDVRTAIKARGQVAEVLRFFNVKVTSRDIFSRCQACNGNKYVEVTRSNMKRLWLKAHLAKAGPGERDNAAAPRPSEDEVSSEIAPLADLDNEDDFDQFESADDHEDGREEFVYKGPATSRLSPSAVASVDDESDHAVHIYDTSSLRNDLGIDFATTKFSNDVAIQVDVVPEGILNQVDVFYVCSECGKVFWAGGHFQRITEQFHDIISKD